MLIYTKEYPDFREAITVRSYREDGQRVFEFRVTDEDDTAVIFGVPAADVADLAKALLIGVYGEDGFTLATGEVKTSKPGTHVHAVKDWPNTSSGGGYGVCECGATIAVYHGKTTGEWHACAKCSTNPAKPGA